MEDEESFSEEQTQMHHPFVFSNTIFEVELNFI